MNKAYIFAGAGVIVAAVVVVALAMNTSTLNIDKMIEEKDCFALSQLEKDYAEGRLKLTSD